MLFQLPSSMKNTSASPITVFYSYSSADESFRRKLEEHLSVLKRGGFIDTWSFRQIEAGEDWKKGIDAKLNASDMILLLVSSNFLASDYCWDIEMKRALERDEAGEAVVVPIILRDCDWHAAPFAKLQALPEGAKPITRWRPHDRAWANVVAALRKRLDSMKAVKLSVKQPTGHRDETSSSPQQRHIPMAHVTSSEPGPWFHLIDSSYENGIMSFAVRNEGAPVVCLDFKSLTPTAVVEDWYPTTLPPSEILRARVRTDQLSQCQFRLLVRDRKNIERTFDFDLDRKRTPAGLDFRETTR